MTYDWKLEIIYPGYSDHNKVIPSNYALNALRKEVTRLTGIDPTVRKSTREQELVEACRLIYVPLRIFTNMSYAAIGQRFGQMNHATVMHHIKTAINFYETNKGYRHTMDTLIEFSEKIFKKRTCKEGSTRLGEEFWRYAAKKIAQELPEVIHCSKEHDQDKDREIRFLKSKIARMELKNSYSYVD